MNRSTALRIQRIDEQLNTGAARILEIGALDAPTFRRPDFNVRYVDYASRQELSKKALTNPRYEFDRLVDVDYVVSGKKYSLAIDERFDLIVANHVVEHIPDVIGWLYDLGELLLPGGALFLSVPDKRFTFDISRRDSTFADLIRPHLDRQTRPDFVNILEHYWFHKQVNAAEGWAGIEQAKLDKMRFTHAQCVAHADKAVALPYADVHCHVFTVDSFRTLVEDLTGFGYFGFKSVSVQPAVPGTNEFHVVLRNFDPGLCQRVGKR